MAVALMLYPLLRIYALIGSVARKYPGNNTTNKRIYKQKNYMDNKGQLHLLFDKQSTTLRRKNKWHSYHFYKGCHN